MGYTRIYIKGLTNCSPSLPGIGQEKNFVQKEKEGHPDDVTFILFIYIFLYSLFIIGYLPFLFFFDS
jgi:hypothetical protein